MAGKYTTLVPVRYGAVVACTWPTCTPGTSVTALFSPGRPATGANGAPTAAALVLPNATGRVGVALTGPAATTPAPSVNAPTSTTVLVPRLGSSRFRPMFIRSAPLRKAAPHVRAPRGIRQHRRSPCTTSNGAAQELSLVHPMCPGQ